MIAVARQFLRPWRGLRNTLRWATLNPNLSTRRLVRRPDMHFDWSRIISPHGEAPSLKQVEAFEQTLGFGLPHDYREFILSLNGGDIIPEHQIHVAGAPFPLGVSWLWPFTARSPSLGVLEGRDLQLRNRFCVKQAVAVADDGGTGDYYLILAGRRRGSVAFVWLEDRQMLSAAAWAAGTSRIPLEMLVVCPSFGALGQLILTGES